MPDPWLILEAQGEAALIAIALVLLGGWRWRAPNALAVGLALLLGVVAGFYVGCWRLDLLRMHWPSEDQDRLLLVLLPTVILVEVAVLFLARFQWLVWCLRLSLAAFAARVLLHGSVYLSDSKVSGSESWSLAETGLALGSMAIALGVVWFAVLSLARRGVSDDAQRGAGRSLLLALAVTCEGAAITVMFSSYATGGQIGLPLGTALTGAALASFVLSGKLNFEGALSVGIVGVFALLVIGRYFGELSTAYAAPLFFGMLLPWCLEMPALRRMGPRLRGFLTVLLTAIPVVIVLSLTAKNFNTEQTRVDPTTGEPSSQDYEDYRK